MVDPLALNNYDDIVSCCPALSKFLSYLVLLHKPNVTSKSDSSEGDEGEVNRVRVGPVLLVGKVT